MEALKIMLFGAPRCLRGEEPVTIQRRKAMALVAYLAVTAQPHQRDALATLLWPDQDQGRARGNLRRDLSQLKSLLGDDVLLLDGDLVALSPDAGWRVDVAEYERRLEAVRQHRDAPEDLCPDCLSALTAAVDLYADDFMAGFSLPESLAFDEWQFFQSEGLRQLLADALQRLIIWHSTRHEAGWEPAVDYARRWVALDPLHEPAQRALMETYALAGHQAAALRQYREAVRLLDEELGIEPEPATTALFEAVRTRQFPPSEAESPSTYLPVSTGAGDQPVRSASTPVYQLPTPATSFVGREEELAEVQALLAESTCRLLTLVGAGGIGKTRLALELAAIEQDSFADGACFVSLAACSGPEFLVLTIAEALGLNLTSAAPPQTQLLNYLRSRELLLVADNFEHLIEGAGLLVEMLETAPRMQLIVTSRERLNLQEEWIYEVAGLPYPRWDLSASVSAPEDYGAVGLFVQRARQADPGFELTPGDIPAVIHICQTVAGTPLAIELAAPWVRLMRPSEIAEEIDRSLDFLSTNLQNVPERHRSLKAIFQQTWERLAAEEQIILSQLAYFRGGCTLEALQEVADAALPQLASLVDRTLVRRTRDDRFEMHELIRQFALEQLESQPPQLAQTQAAHSAYYTALLHRLTSDIKGGRQPEALRTIAADIDNVRAAWQYAVDQCEGKTLEQAAECLWLFSEFRGLLPEGEQTFRQAADAFVDPIGDEHIPAENRTLAGILLAGQGCLAARQGRFESGKTLMERGISLLRAAPELDRTKEAFALAWLGFILVMRGHYAEAERHVRDSLELFPETGDQWTRAGGLRLLGAAALYRGQTADAERYLQECLTICQRIGERRIRTFATINLGMITGARGQYDRAEQLLFDALQTSEDCSDPLSQIDALREMGKLAAIRGQYAQAEHYLRDCLSLHHDLGQGEEGAYFGDIMATQNLLGDTLHWQGDYDGAQITYEEALRVAEALDHQPGLARALTSLGELAFAQGDAGRAESHLREAVALWQAIGNNDNLATALTGLGRVLSRRGSEMWEEARDVFRQALQLIAEHPLIPPLLETLVGVAGLLSQAGNSTRAVELLALAAHHRLSPHHIRGQARQQLTDLEEDISVSAYRQAIERGQTLDEQAVVADLLANDLSADAPFSPRSRPPTQEIFLCRSPDGVQIAYSIVGEGPVLVKAANWLSHLEYDWNSPVWRHWLEGLSARHTLVRYDERGCGLSDWDIPEFSLDAFVQDLETVVDALGLERFSLLGISQGGSVAITYAHRHPEKVSHLILYGTYSRGRFKRGYSPEETARAKMSIEMMKVGWGQDNPAYRQFFTTTFMPEATQEQMQWFNDLQRISATPDNAIRIRSAFSYVEVTDLARQLDVPTLILHAREDAAVPFDEGRRLAATIPNARFIGLEGRNHILLEDEPAWPRFLASVEQFIASE